MRYIFILLFLLSCSSPGVDKGYLEENYSKEDLRFFVQVGFYNQRKVLKWEEDIHVSFVGSPNTGDVELVDSIIQELRPLLAPLTIERTDKDGNLKIKLVEKAKKGLATHHTVFAPFYSFSQSEIELPVSLKSTLRQATLRHEFLHALGLHHPTEKGTGTIIESSVEYASIDDALNSNAKIYRYSNLDKRMVKLLYDKNIRVGLERSTFAKLLEK